MADKIRREDTVANSADPVLISDKISQDLMLKFCGSDDSAFADLGERIDLIKNLDELTLA